jgi:hypothetical protein
VGHLLDIEVLSGMSEGQIADFYKLNPNPTPNEVGAGLSGSWRRKRLFKEVFDAMEASQSYESIRTDVLLTKDRREYLLSRHELWARAYAQFIAEESDSLHLKGDLVKMLERTQQGKSSAQQWEREDFKAIRAAIRKLFTKLRWIS